MGQLLTDLRLAVRQIGKRPIFAAMVAMTLALGIGANTAIFTVVDGVLLRPLPYRAPAELVTIWSKWTNFEKTWVSAFEYFGYRAESRLFRDVAVWSDEGSVTLTGDGAPESVQMVSATNSLVSVLGISPAVGRVITPAEDVPNGPNVVMIGYDLWRRRFGADPAMIGKNIRIDGASWQVIGVLPQGFRLPLEFQAARPAELMGPARLDPANPTNDHSFFAVARLGAGVTVDQVSGALAGLATRWTGEGLYPVAMRFTAFAVGLEDEVSGGVRRAIVVLAASVGLLLLIACANVANLLLVRADGRAREVAVRAALGAGRGALLRLVMAESVVLAMVGGAVGVGLAVGGIQALKTWAPTSLPRAADLRVDLTVLAFAAVMSLVTGLLFGAVPALRSTETELLGSLKDGGRAGSGGRGRRRLRNGLVSIEMAISVILVIGASLTYRSFRNLISIDPGFDVRNRLTLRLVLPPSDYPDTGSLVRFFGDLGDDVRRLPNVMAAGFVRVLPIAAEIGDAGMAIEGREVGPKEPSQSADWQVVTPGYFEAMGIRLVAGRFPDATDSPDAVPVIAINQTLAREYFPNQDPLGQRIRVGGPTTPWRTVIGVVGDTRHNGLTNPYKRAWFIPHTQFATAFGETRRAMTLVVKTAGSPRVVLPAITALIEQRDKNLPLTEVATLDDVMSGAVKEQRFIAVLMGGLALLTLVLASVGIYGVVSYAVSERTREIGVRLALGADPGRVRSMVVRQGMGPVGLGIGVGVLAAAGLTQTLKSILYGVAPLDPSSFALVPFLLVLVAIGAALRPAYRATRIDPIEALRPD